MFKRLYLLALWLLSLDANAVLGEGDKFDFTPLTGEFCNQVNDQKQLALLKQFPSDMGIVKLYGLYIGLCQLISDGVVTEYVASMEWGIEREKLLATRGGTKH